VPQAAERVPLATSQALDQPTADQPIAQPVATAAAADDAQDVIQKAAAETASDTTADAAPAATTSAALPLPESTIARTIQRIGYGCGRVVSATAVDGSAGVFKISCSSGDTYRAAPVGGRYHFRRWGSH